MSRRPATPITPAVPEPAGATPMFTVGEQIAQAMTANEPQRLPGDLVALLKREASLRSFDDKAKKFLRAKGKEEKVRQRRDHFEREVNCPAYPPGIRPLRLSDTATEYSEPWSAAITDDATITITIKKGATLKEALSKSTLGVLPACTAYRIGGGGESCRCARRGS